MTQKIGLFVLTGLVLALCLLCAGCTDTQGTPGLAENKVSIGYVTWDSEIASTNVIKQVFEKAGYDAEIVAVDAGPLYQGIAKGDIDCTVSAWLPITQANFWEKFGDDIDHVRKNLEGARVGLVVPTYVTIDSIEDLNSVSDKFGGEIIGIDPGAGVMQNTEEVITEYGLEYELVASSSAGMAAELRTAINKEEWIVVTGWTPHWMFARWDLKYLDDPKGVYGGEEYIGTLARKGLAEEKPGIYGILERFHWTPADMESVMLAIENGESEQDAAKAWVDAHPDKVAEWIGEN